MSEQEHVESLAHTYFSVQIPFDKKLVYLGYLTLKPYLHGPEGLELGSGDGDMTKYLIADFAQLTVVDGSAQLLAGIPDMPNLVKEHSLFEEFVPDQKFNTIIMGHILEHIENPVLLFRRAKHWLVPDGKILAIVPNGQSFHRLAAVKMGLLKDPCELNARDLAVGHRRVYMPETFKRDIEAAGLSLIEVGGIFFKPLSNQ
jgi:trans-aconitate methyltransferase